MKQNFTHQRLRLDICCQYYNLHELTRLTGLSGIFVKATELNTTRRRRPSVRRLIICAWIWQHGPWETQRGREKERSGDGQDVTFLSSSLFFAIFSDPAPNRNVTINWGEFNSYSCEDCVRTETPARCRLIPRHYKRSLGKNPISFLPLFYILNIPRIHFLPSPPSRAVTLEPLSLRRRLKK